PSPRTPPPSGRRAGRSAWSWSWQSAPPTPCPRRPTKPRRSATSPPGHESSRDLSPHAVSPRAPADLPHAPLRSSKTAWQRCLLERGVWVEATGRTGSSGARDRRIDDGHDDPRHDHAQGVPGPQLIGAADNVKATVTITFSGKHFKPVPSHRFLGASAGDHLLSVAIGSTTKVGVALTAVANGSWQRWRTDPTV